MSQGITYTSTKYVDSITTRKNLVREARATLAGAGRPEQHVERIVKTHDGFIAYMVTGVPSPRPAEQMVKVPRTVPLTEVTINKFSDTQRQSGRTVVDVDFISHTITTAELTPAVKDVRDRLAFSLGTKPYEIDVSATWDPEVGIDAIYIKRLPIMKDEEVTKARLLAALPQVGGSIYWKVELAPVHAAAKLTYQPKDSLPLRVALDDVLPSRVDPTRWKKVLLGVDPKGQPFYQSLTGTPHVLSQGPTGSGKTVALTTLCASHLVNGADLIICDAVKGGGDFKGLQPFSLGWADSLESVADAVKQAYAEGQRRKAILLEIGKVKVADCTPEEVEKYKLSPMVVLLDEFGSLVIPLDIPKSADKNSELVMEATAQNEAKTEIKLYCGKIARELRFVSIFLIVATQVAQVAIVGSGEFRSNLGMKIQSIPVEGSVSTTDLGMLFDASMMDSVRERIHTLSSGLPGLTIVASEGGAAQGIKVPWAEAKDIEGLLHKRGVPVVTQPMVLKRGKPLIKPSMLPSWLAKPAEAEDTADTEEATTRTPLEAPDWLDDMDLTDVDPL